MRKKKNTIVPIICFAVVVDLDVTACSAPGVVLVNTTGKNNSVPI